ncbi:MAG: hypothetical protein ABSA08_00780 [Acidimicrobiales bacterium]|jgi:hypothetical protein
MTSRARLLRGTAGITEITDLGPVTVHLVKTAANGFRELAAKSLREPKATSRRRRPTARLTVGP